MQQLLIRNLGHQAYQPVFEAMQAFTDTRDAHTMDEFWVVEHEPVFTQGLNGRPEHLLNPGTIPIVQVDRGGQVTYHGPGQIVIYTLIDVRRRGTGVRALVTALEQSVIALLDDMGIEAEARSDAPGVYVAGRKIAALGLRVRRGSSYHGLSLNWNMDLSPFQRINPCGYQGLEVEQLADLGIEEDFDTIAWRLCGYLARQLGYTMPAGEGLPPSSAIPQSSGKQDVRQ
jgi:lipoyl(octanoyl) transferase